MLGGEEQACADRAFIHYGEGRLLLRARRAPTGCGRAIRRPAAPSSCPTPTHPRAAAMTAGDVEVADLLFGDEQGADVPRRLRLRGAAAGERRAHRIWEGHPEHPLAKVARLIQGVNAAREFKEIEADNTVTSASPTPPPRRAACADHGRRRRAQAGGQAQGRGVRRRPRWHGSCTRRSHRRRRTPRCRAIVARRREIAAEVGTASTDRHIRGSGPAPLPANRAGRHERWERSGSICRGASTGSGEICSGRGSDAGARGSDDEVHARPGGLGPARGSRRPGRRPRRPARAGVEQTVEALVAGEACVVARVEDDQLVIEQLAEAPYYL